MSKELLTVDVAEGIGGPSFTAVFKEHQLPFEKMEQVAVLKKAFKKLQTLGHVVSKLAIVSSLEDSSELSFRSIQVRGADENKDPILEGGGNCGNSMIASTLVSIREKYRDSLTRGITVRIRNVDTNFIADMEVVDDSEISRMTFDMHIVHLTGQILKNALLKETSATWFVPVDGEQIPVTTLNIANPYIIVPSTSIGIKDTENLLRAEDQDDNVLERVKNIRSAVIRILALSPDSEFPKIAAVHAAGTMISARTLYLQKWHPGLPITGAISLVVATQIKNSVLDLTDQSIPSDGITIQTPQEKEKLYIETSKPSEAIVKCVVRNREAVLHQSGIEIIF